MLTIARVANYLRLDADILGNIEELELQEMIDASMLYFEKETNHILTPQVKEYDPCQKIYDYPIADVSGLIKRSNYYINKNQISLLEVGYEEGEVPKDIEQCLLQIIKVWYYESEQESNSTLMPKSVNQVIEKYRRFWV